MKLLTSNVAYNLDPVLFASDCLNFKADPWQQKALRWTGQRMILNCCRQSGKSTVSAILAVHRALFFPGSLILLISPSLRQSGELFKKVLEELDKIPDQPRRTENNKLSLQFESKSRIVSLPSTEGTIRGYSGVSLIIEDESSRVDDALHYAIRPMLAVSGGRLLLLSTPFGKRGHFFEEWTSGKGWEKIEIPASKCPRISKNFLAEEKRALGDWHYRQEYECQFMENIDSVFRTDDIEAAICEDLKPLKIGGASSE
ncbi:MAG: terminase family protein [Bacillota bacterium]|nr:terminase family protein [Bacillota bacterium]